MLFFETSAKTGAGIENVYMNATQEIIKKNPGIVTVSNDQKKKNISLTNDSTKNKENTECC